MQNFSFDIKREMPTAGGSSDPEDFEDGGTLNGTPPPLWPATNYPKGTVEGGNSSITKRDGVYIVPLQKIGQGGVIIDFKMRSAGFQFRLTRGDGTLITEENGLLIYFRVYNSQKQYLSITTPIYDIDTEYWSFGLVNPEDIDPDGFWVRFRCVDGLNTIYPFKYKPDDQYKVEDLIPFGEYDAKVPYWNVSEIVYFPEPIYTSPHPMCIYTPFVIASGGGRWWLTKTGFTMKKIVKSSIPFKVAYEVKAHYGSQRVVQSGSCYPILQAEYNVSSNDGFLNYDYSMLTPACVESGWLSGDVSGTDVQINIVVGATANNCTQMWIANSTTCPWTIYISYLDFDPSPC